MMEDYVATVAGLDGFDVDELLADEALDVGEERRAPLQQAMAPTAAAASGAADAVGAKGGVRTADDASLAQGGAAAVVAATQHAVVAKGAPGVPPTTITAPSSAAAFLTMMAAMATGAGANPSGGAGSSHQAEGVPAKELVKLVLQLEARIRSLEASMYITMFVPMAHRAVVEMMLALRTYQAITKEHPFDHGLGGAEGVLFLALLKGLVNTPLAPSVDLGIESRMAALCLLYATILAMPPAMIGEFATHLVVAELQGARKGFAIVSFKVDGSMTLPMIPEHLQLCRAAAAAAFETNSIAELLKLAPRSFTMEDGEPVAVGTAISVQKIITTLVSTTGGSRAVGRAPASGQARVVKGKGKGRKGK